RCLHPPHHERVDRLQRGPQPMNAVRMPRCSTAFALHPPQATSAEQNHLHQVICKHTGEQDLAAVNLATVPHAPTGELAELCAFARLLFAIDASERNGHYQRYHYARAVERAQHRGVALTELTIADLLEVAEIAHEDHSIGCRRERELLKPYQEQ